MTKLHWIKNPSVSRPNAYFYVAFDEDTKYTVVKLSPYSPVWQVYQEHLSDGQQKLAFAKTAKQGQAIAEKWRYLSDTHQQMEDNMDKKQDLVADILEPIVDKHGLLNVVTALQLMCEEKAGYIRTNWQDDGLAKEWDKASRHFEQCVVGLSRLL